MTWCSCEKCKLKGITRSQYSIDYDLDDDLEGCHTWTLGKNAWLSLSRQRKNTRWDNDLENRGKIGVIIEQLDMKQIKKDALNSGNYDLYIEEAVINKVNELIFAYNNRNRRYDGFPPNYKGFYNPYTNHKR